MKTVYFKNIILIFFLACFLLSSSVLIGQETKVVASCCEEETGKCTGSAYCTACKNCKYCKYCNNGGSCGVCSGGSRKTYTPKRTSYPSTSRNSFTKKKNKSKIYSLPNDRYSKYYLKTLMVNTIALNLRTGPGTEYIIIEKLNKYQELVFLAMTGNWVKVKVKSTNTIGFVHYKYVIILNE